MRTSLRLLAALPLLSVAALSAQVPAYTIDSTGLNLVNFDGGVSDFRFADINDDGYLDILSVGDHGSPNVNTSQHGIMVFYGNGTGSGWTLFQNGNFGYGGIAVGDVNNDGLKDVGYGVHHNYSSTSFGDQYLEVALGNGTGMAWTPYDGNLGLQGQTYGMFCTDFADIDNDGLLDLGSNSFGCCDGVHVYQNLGNGSWNRSFGFIGGNANDQFQFADLNNDGYIDFIATRQGGTVYFGSGNGQFTLQDAGLPPSGILGFDIVDAADVDGDSLLELAFCFNGGMYIYKWNALAQQWVNISGNLPASGGYQWISLADMNSDGFADVVTVTPGNVWVYLGSGLNTWTAATIVPVPNLNYIRDIAIADVDFSGRPDILVFARYPAGTFNSINKLYLLKETGTAQQYQLFPAKPGPGECYPGGAVRFIRWSSSLPQVAGTRVSLELSTSGPGGPFTPVATRIPNNGEFQWPVPAGIQSANCVIRYTLTDSLGSVQYAAVLSPVFSIGCGLTAGIPDPVLERTSVFPNPASEEVYLVLPGRRQETLHIGIFDVSGRMVREQEAQRGEGVYRLALTGLRSGIYFIRPESSPAMLKVVKL